MTPKNTEACSLHIFVDVIKDAYAVDIFLRIEIRSEVELIFIAAKSRVASLKNVTILRMELLSVTVGERLTQTIKDVLGWVKMKKYYWCELFTVGAWISKDDNGPVFVQNRVLQIRRLSSPSWMHLSSDKNLADVPTRGCKAGQRTAKR